MWRAYITDIHTGLIEQPLDIPNFSWTLTVNDSSLSTTRPKTVGKDDVQSITLPWSAVPGHTARQRFEAIEPGRKAIALFWQTEEDEENGVIGTPILWGGIGVRTDNWDSTSFNLTSVYSLLDSRYVVREGQYHDGTSKDSIVFSGMSLRGIASEVGYLCTDAKPGGELPVDWTYRGEKHPLQSGEDTSIHRRVYEAWNVANQSGKKLLSDLASVQGGPDMQFRPYLTSDGQHVRLRFEAGSDTEPYLGQSAVRGFSCWPGGGTLENVEVSYLAPTQRVYATGAGEDAATLTALAEDLTQVTGPAHVALSEAQYSDTDAKDLALLQSHARARLEASSRPLMQLSGEIHFDDPYVPQPGMFWPGQLISLGMEGHPSLPDGQYMMRVMEMSGDATDKAKLIMDAQPVPWDKTVKAIDAQNVEDAQNADILTDANLKIMWQSPAWGWDGTGDRWHANVGGGWTYINPSDSGIREMAGRFWGGNTDDYNGALVGLMLQPGDYSLVTPIFDTYNLTQGISMNYSLSTNGKTWDLAGDYGHTWDDMANKSLILTFHVSKPAYLGIFVHFHAEPGTEVSFGKPQLYHGRRGGGIDF